MKEWRDPKLFLSVLLIGLFAFGYFRDGDSEQMEGAVIAAFAAAYGYWLGSSSGSARKTEILKGEGDD